VLAYAKTHGFCSVTNRVLRRHTTRNQKFSIDKKPTEKAKKQLPKNQKNKATMKWKFTVQNPFQVMTLYNQYQTRLHQEKFK